MQRASSAWPAMLPKREARPEGAYGAPECASEEPVEPGLPELWHAPLQQLLPGTPRNRPAALPCPAEINEQTGAMDLVCTWCSCLTLVLSLSVLLHLGLFVCRYDFQL